jgi:drug/metabolite transporter (DMT)-like permease
MSISRPTKIITSALIFVLLVALTLPKLPRAHIGQAGATWDTGSYIYFGLLFVPLLCIWLGAQRNRVVEIVGWSLLLLLTIGSYFVTFVCFCSCQILIPPHPVIRG